MKTDELVTMLATGVIAVDPHAVERRYVAGLGLGVIAAALLMVGVLGVREDLIAATRLPMFWVKIAFVSGLTLASLLATLRLSRPGVALGRVPAGVATPVAALWMLAAAVLLAAAPEQRVQMFFGETWAVCPFLIAMLSIPVFAGSLWAMAGLAPTRLRLAGATAGLLSGSVAALVYSLHCPEMAAPFLAFWYLLGIMIPAAIGALIGPRLLHW